MDLDMLKEIVKSLRTKPDLDRYVYKGDQMINRGPAPGNQGLIKGLRDKSNYGRYQKVSNDMGESPVSYEEWLQK